MKRYRTVIGVVVVILATLGMFWVHPFDGTGDFYHHINFGKWVVQHGQLMKVDEFSHTAKGWPVIDHSWASGVIMYLIFKGAGQEGIRWWAAGMAGLVAGLAYLWLVELEANPGSAVVTVLTGMGVMAVRWPDRPELFGYLFLIVMLLIDVFRHRKKELILLVPGVIWLWSIFYGVGVLAGLALVTVLAVKSRNKLFYAMAAISWPLAFVNGYGSDTVLYFFKYIPQVAAYEAEWAGIVKLMRFLSPELLVTYQFFIYVYAIFAVVWLVAMIGQLGKWRERWFWLGVGGVAVLVPLWAFRQVVNVVIVALPTVAWGWEKKWQMGVLAVLGVGMWLLVAWAQSANASQSDKAFGDMVSFVRQNGITGRAFNHIHMGGELTYELYPQILVFYDTRDDLYLRSGVWRDLYDVFVSGESVVPLLQKYQVEVVFGDRISDGLNYSEVTDGPGWRVVWSEDRYFVALPDSEAQAKGLPRVNLAEVNEVPQGPVKIYSDIKQETTVGMANLVRGNCGEAGKAIMTAVNTERWLFMLGGGPTEPTAALSSYRERCR